MQTNVFDEMHIISHHDEQKLQMLLKYLPLLQKDKKQRGFLKKLKKQWDIHNKSTKSNHL